MQQHQLIVRQLNIQPYSDVSRAMHIFSDRRTDFTSDEIWLVQHPAVYTQGQTGSAEHLLFPTVIPVIQSDRGGQITYHGPGQQIMYVMINLRRQKTTVRQLVSSLEQSVINTLKQFNIESYSRKDAPGIYVHQEKICSLGLRIRKGCSLHGLALNVDMDLTPFNAINPCGYTGLKMTRISNFVSPVTIEQVQSMLLKNFIQLLNYQRVEFNDWSMTDYD